MRKNRGGFTLLEMLVALPIALLILAGALLLFRVGIDSFNRAYRNSDAHYALRHARTYLLEDITAGQGYVIYDRPNGSRLRDGTPGGCLEIFRTTEAGNVYRVQYYADLQQFYRMDGSNKAPVTELMRSARFTGLGSGLVRIELEAGTRDETYFSCFKSGVRAR